MKQFNAFELEIYNTRSNKDARKKVDRYIVSYRDEKENEYRKSYEFPVSTPFETVKKDIPMELE